MLWLGGDVHLGAGGVDVLAPLASELAGAVGIVNLEGPVGPGAGKSSAERLVNDARALPLLATYGVAVAGIANNHAGDLGPGGRAQTRRALAAAGIESASGDDVAIIERHGLRLAIAARDLSYGVPPGLAGDLRRVRARADILLVTFHVVAPPLYFPRPELREAVDIALAAGALVVAAHGSHILAKVERRGPAIIAWGLGNLVFACDCTRESDGLIVRVELMANKVVNATVIPIDAGLGSQPARPSEHAALMLDLLESLRLSPLSRAGPRAFF